MRALLLAALLAPAAALGQATKTTVCDQTGRRCADVPSAGGALTVAPTPYATTAFGEARVAQPYTLLDLVNKYGRDAFELDTQTAGGGAVANVLPESAIRLSVGTGTTDAARLRTNTFFRYQAGRGQRFTQTVYLSAAAGAAANQAVRWGYFDANDGLFWQRSGGVTSFCRRTSTSGAPVDTCTAITLPLGADLTKGSIYEVGFQWLGVGTVTAWWNGTRVHEVAYANSLSAPYMRTADLPLSWEIVNTGAGASAASITVICANVTVQGGSDAPEYAFAISRAFKTGIGATEVPILAIRLASTLGGVDNRSVVLPHFVRAQNASGRASFRVILNPASLTGASWVAADATSGVEYDVSATAFTGGREVSGGYLPTTTSEVYVGLEHFFAANALKLRRTAFAGTSDVLLIVGRSEAAGTAEIGARLEWTEIR